MTDMTENTKAVECRELDDLIARVEAAVGEYHLWDRHIGGEVIDTLQEYRRHLAQPAVPEGVACAYLLATGKATHGSDDDCSHCRHPTPQPDTAQGERGAVDACARVSAFVTEYRRRIAANPRGGMDPEDVYSLGMAGDPLVLRISDLAALTAPTGDQPARAVDASEPAELSAEWAEHVAGSIGAAWCKRDLQVRAHRSQQAASLIRRMAAQLFAPPAAQAGDGENGNA